jgi:hypothetical protein
LLLGELVALDAMTGVDWLLVNELKVRTGAAGVVVWG